MASASTYCGIKEFIIDENYNWLIQSLSSDFSSFLPMGTKEGKSERVVEASVLFRKYGRGVATCRDDWTYDFNKNHLAHKIKRFIDTYNGELDRWRRRGSD